METVADGVSEIHGLLSAYDPMSRLPETVYLDAQAVVQWFRLGVIDHVWDGVPRDSRGFARFTLLGVAFKEAVDVLSDRTTYSREQLEDYLKNEYNLHTGDRPTDARTIIGRRALDLQARMSLLEGATTPPKGSQNMGEAETLAHIEHLEPGAMFVTGDRGAIMVAHSTGVVVPIRPLAFASIALADVSRLESAWQFFCRARSCLTAGAAVEECLEGMKCTWSDEESAARGVLSARVTSAVDLLRWVKSDLTELVDAVSAS